MVFAHDYTVHVFMHLAAELLMSLQRWLARMLACQECMSRWHVQSMGDGVGSIGGYDSSADKLACFSSLKYSITVCKNYGGATSVGRALPLGGLH
jgi:hypothetical protein